MKTDNWPENKLSRCSDRQLRISSNWQRCIWWSVRIGMSRCWESSLQRMNCKESVTCPCTVYSFWHNRNCSNWCSFHLHQECTLHGTQHTPRCTWRHSALRWTLHMRRRDKWRSTPRHRCRTPRKSSRTSRSLTGNKSDRYEHRYSFSRRNPLDTWSTNFITRRPRSYPLRIC